MPLTFEAILSKSGDSWVVGGVASNFFKDLDGDAIAPEAIQRAIPGFMANRGPDGIKGGPIRLHHGFWERFLKQALTALNLPYEEQMNLLTAISLPLGRVTELKVEPDGTTRWKGVLSQANPIAKTVWSMLKEGMVHLGVSVGGRINAVRPGRDALGRTCNLITDVRLDELSITDNPANRLLESESPDNGAYIMALQKSLSKRAAAPGQMGLFDEKQLYSTRSRPAPGDGLTKSMLTAVNTAMKETVQGFLRKAIAGNPVSETNSGSWGETTVPMSRGLKPVAATKPMGTSTIKMDASGDGVGQAIAGMQPKAMVPSGAGGMPPTDVWGMTVQQMTQALAKCAAMDKDAWGSPETVQLLTDSAHGLMGLTDAPPPALINMVRFLGYLNRFAQEVPHMDDYQAAGTVKAMGEDLAKALDTFVEELPKKLMGKPIRPDGSPMVAGADVQFPQQYVIYS